MKRDPSHYRQRANYFYSLANANGLNDPEQQPDDDSEYEYVEAVDLEPVIIEEPVKKPTCTVSIKPAYKRYYDPVTRHYYRTDQVLGIDNTAAAKNADGVWYPENQPERKTARDPVTGEHFRITKVYDSNGNYTHQYEKIHRQPRKAPGTDFYRNNWKK